MKARFTTSISLNEDDKKRQEEIAKRGFSIMDTLRKGQEFILKVLDNKKTKE